MKRKSCLYYLLAILSLAFIASPVSENHFNDVDLTADCESYSINVTGRLYWNEVCEVSYELNYTPELPFGSVKGSFEIPIPLEEDERNFNVTQHEVFGDIPCDEYTINGTVNLICGEILVDTASLPEESVVCPCDDECSECDGKVTELTLQYTGDLLDPPNITVSQKDGDIVFDEIVDLGEDFTIYGTEIKAKKNDAKLPTLGTEITIDVNGDFNTNIHTSCSRYIGPGMVTENGDFTVIEAYSLNGGLICEGSPNDDSEGDSCGTCDGKITELTLSYLGLDDATIRVEMKKKGVIFEGFVDSFEEFTFEGIDKKGTMGTEITIYIDDVEDTKIHTSCSVPIYPGLVSDSFEIIAGSSRNGGPISIGSDNCDDSDLDKDKKKKDKKKKKK
jgi:hypothetical protein